MEKTKLIKILLGVLGSLFLTIGIIGIFLPILPTAPFLVVSAGCFAKSSEAMHNWLLTNRLFGKYIRNHQEGKGLPLKMRLISVALLWFALSLSIIYCVHLPVRILLVVVGFGVTIHIMGQREKEGVLDQNKSL